LLANPGQALTSDVDDASPAAFFAHLTLKAIAVSAL